MHTLYDSPGSSHTCERLARSLPDVQSPPSFATLQLGAKQLTGLFDAHVACLLGGRVPCLVLHQVSMPRICTLTQGQCHVRMWTERHRGMGSQRESGVAAWGMVGFADL